MPAKEHRGFFFVDFLAFLAATETTITGGLRFA
jgi:hypothetical protein